MNKNIISYEQVAYLMFMLRVNEPKYYYEWYNDELENEEILCDLILSLSETNIDINGIISTLNRYLLQKRCKIDMSCVLNMICDTLNELKSSGKVTIEALVNKMYIIGSASRDFVADMDDRAPWEMMCNFCMCYDEVVDGYITRESFEEMLNTFITEKGNIKAINTYYSFTDKSQVDKKGKAAKYLSFAMVLCLIVILVVWAVFGK